MLTDHKVTFSFGKNWVQFVDGLSESDIDLAIQDIKFWLGDVRDKSVVDIGSGSGINSLSFSRLGAKSVHSFDFDPLSVEASKKLQAKFGSTANWTIEQGSVLDTNYLNTLGQFDIVYSWGVLHHTGAMWDAIENSISLVARGGKMWIALYVKGPRYLQDLALKQKFNAATDFRKRIMIRQRILRKMASAVKHRRNPLKWNHTVSRGMNEYHDILDWLGGLPYETATEDEVVQFVRRRGLVLERLKVCREGDLSKYVFSIPS